LKLKQFLQESMFYLERPKAVGSTAMHF